MPTTLKILVSGTMVDLKPERDAVARAIESLHLDAVRAETEFSEDRPSRDKIVEMAHECEIYLGLYSQTRYGWTIPQDGISVTELEFNEAQRLLKPTLIFVKVLPRVWAPQNADEEEQREKQKTFINRVLDFESGKFRATEFENLIQLEEQVARSLMTLFIRRFKLTVTYPSTEVPPGHHSTHSPPTSFSEHPAKLGMADNAIAEKDRVQSSRKLEAYKAVCSALDTVCGLLGYKYRILHCSPDKTRITLLFVRVYDLSARKAMEVHQGAPSLALDWGQGEEVKTVNNLSCGDDDLPAIRVEFTIYDSNFDRELLTRLWSAINQSNEACLVARWPFPYLEKVAQFYEAAIREAVKPLGWEISPGYWEHGQWKWTNDLNTWEVWARSPRGSQTEDVRIYLHPLNDGITIHAPFDYHQEDNPLHQAFVEAALAAFYETKRELEELPLWVRIVESTRTERVSSDTGNQ